jgi:hypothetical protein
MFGQLIEIWNNFWDKLKANNKTKNNVGDTWPATIGQRLKITQQKESRGKKKNKE